MNYTRNPKSFYEYIPAGGRNVGRPRKRWRDQHSLRWNKPAMPYTLRLMVSTIINHYCCQHFVQICYFILISLWCFLVGPRLPTHCRCRVLFLHLVTLSDTHTHTFCTTPLDQWSAPHRRLYLHNTQYSQETDIHAPGGIRTRNPCNTAATVFVCDYLPLF